MHKFIKILIASFLIVSFIAESALIRRGGRASSTSTAPNTYYLIDDTWVVSDPDDHPTLAADTYNNAFSDSSSWQTTSGKYSLLVVPFDGCAEEYNYDYYDGVPDEFLPVWDGCTWEFTEVEDLFVYGDFPAYLPGAFDYQINFAIVDDSGRKWDLAGTIDNATNQVVLDTPRPTDLGIGEYTISVSVNMISGSDKTFFHNYDENSGLQVDCVTRIKSDDFCFVSNGLSVSDTLSFSSDFSETLRIVPSLTSVNAPNSFVILLSVLGVGLYQRRRSILAL